MKTLKVVESWQQANEPQSPEKGDVQLENGGNSLSKQGHCGMRRGAGANRAERYGRTTTNTDANTDTGLDDLM